MWASSGGTARSTFDETRFFRNTSSILWRGAARLFSTPHSRLSVTRRRSQQTTKWLTAQWKKAAGREDAIKLLWDRTSDVRRGRSVGLPREHCISHLVQCLDRIAACFIIVGACPISVKKAGWGTARQLAVGCLEGRERKDLEPL